MNPTQKQFSLNRAASKKQFPISNTLQVDIKIVRTQPFEQLERLLRNVRLVGNPNVKIYEHATILLKKYALDDLYPTTLYALSGNLLVQAKIFNALKAQGKNLFELTGLMEYECTGQLYRMMPPIIEKYVEPTLGKEVAAIIDGQHRLLTARAAGLQEVWVIEITGVDPRLQPVLPTSWDEITVYDTTPTSDKKRRYRYNSPDEYPDLPETTSASVTNENYIGYLYRNFGAMGSNGLRKGGSTS